MGYFSEPSLSSFLGWEKASGHAGSAAGTVCAASASYLGVSLVPVSFLLNSSNAGTNEWRSLDQIPNSPTSCPLLRPSASSPVKHYGERVDWQEESVRVTVCAGDRVLAELTVREAELIGNRGNFSRSPKRALTPQWSPVPCVYPFPLLLYSIVDMCFCLCLCPLH